MKKADVKIGASYLVRVSGKLSTVRIDSVSQYGGWDATNIDTGRKVRLKTAGRLRRELVAPTKLKLSTGMVEVPMEGRMSDTARRILVEASFPELTDAENKEVQAARAAGYAAFFPCVPSAESQARFTLLGARRYSAGAKATSIATSIEVEVLRLMGEGVIPNDAKSFSELHDYCDANVLGDQEECVPDENMDEDSEIGSPSNMWATLNAAQNIVDAWLKARLAK